MKELRVKAGYGVGKHAVMAKIVTEETGLYGDGRAKHETRMRQDAANIVEWVKDSLPAPMLGYLREAINE